MSDRDQAVAQVNEPAPGTSNQTSTSQTRLFSSVAASGSGPGSVSGTVEAGGPVTPAVTPVFKTPLPEGPFRDEIVVEVQTMDGIIFGKRDQNKLIISLKNTI